MAVPFIRTSFNAGEVSPSLFGHVDFAKYALAASTMRNCFVSYRGGANSRAGTRFVGFSAQTGRDYPPRLIPFQFSTRTGQGLVLEFGNTYMRPIVDGAYTTDVTLPISVITSTNPCQITMPWYVAFSAIPKNDYVTASYSPGEQVTVAGGVNIDTAVLNVDSTTLLSAGVVNQGSGGYTPGDTIEPIGGNQTVACILTVQYTIVLSAIIVNGGTGGTPGVHQVAGTTGSGSKFTANATISADGVMTAITLTDGGQYGVNPTTGFYASSVTINGAKTTATYAPGDTITIAGGTLSGNYKVSPTILTVTNTTLVKVDVANYGHGYLPGDSIGLAGGTQQTVNPSDPSSLSLPQGTSSTASTPTVATVIVSTVRVTGATVQAGGSGGTDGAAQIVTGTTGGPGTRFSASVVISGGTITSVNSITVPGSYATAPTDPTKEPVTGAGLTGAKLALTLGADTVTVTTGGVFTSNPAGGNFSQASTTGAGSEATFDNALLAPNAVSIQTPGSYTVLPINPVDQASTSGTGVGCKFTIGWSGPTSNLDNEPIEGVNLVGAIVAVTMGCKSVNVKSGGVFIQNTGIMTQGWSDGTGSGATFGSLLYGVNAFSIADPGKYEITPPNLNTQSFSNLSGLGIEFTVNWYGAENIQITDWLQLSNIPGMPTLSGKTVVIADKTSQTFTLYDVYGNPVDATNAGHFVGEGSASRIYTLVTPYAENDLKWLKYAQSADVISLCCWNQDSGMSYPTYDLKRVADNNWQISQPSFQASITPPTGLVGSSSDTGKTDFQYQVTSISAIDSSESIGSAIVDIPNAVDITSTAGSNTIRWNEVPNASFYNVYRAAPGYNTTVPVGSAMGYVGYATGTEFIDSNIVPDLSQGIPTHDNPLADNPPGCVAYFQDRKFYAGSPQNPDTYWASKPGAYKNFDSRIPSIADDSLSGTPWSIQVNGIQFMVQMLGGLVILTGQDAWLLNGSNSSPTVAQPLTPSSQQAIPQAYNGCSSTVPPIKIEHDLLYVQQLGSIVRDLAYNFWVGVFTGADLTALSSHLFNYFQILQWAYAEEPYKIIWAVRDDGVLLSLTFLKAQEVAGWSRSDTQGSFVSVATVREPPRNAVYVAVRRQTPESPNAYFVERMDDRVWNATEDAWCVDAGLAVDLPEPDGTLTVSSPTGLGACTGVTGLVGGQNYSPATTASVVDDNGAGSRQRGVADPDDCRWRHHQSRVRARQPGHRVRFPRTGDPGPYQRRGRRIGADHAQQLRGVHSNPEHTSGRWRPRTWIGALPSAAHL